MTNVPDRSVLRCGDSDRQQVVDLLNDAYAEGRLSLAEHDERTNAAWAAKTFGDLVPLTADLTAVGQQLAPSSRPGTAVVRANPGSTDSWTTVMGTHRVEGITARLPEHSSATAIMGDVILDLSQGTLDASHCTISVNVVMGTLKVTVPAGVNVEIRTTNIMSEAKTSGLRPGGPGAPTIVITGFALMGEVKVYGPDHVGLAKRLGLSR